ncbi:hypothetical protein KC352_g38708, partial [Hortaea werneckii]
MDDLYDEFGNYIGEERESDEEEDQTAGVSGAQYLDDDDVVEDAATTQEVMDLDDEGPSNAVV